MATAEQTVARIEAAREVIYATLTAEEIAAAQATINADMARFESPRASKYYGADVRTVALSLRDVAERAAEVEQPMSIADMMKLGRK
jgi:hypothetical protein